MNLRMATRAAIAALSFTVVAAAQPPANPPTENQPTLSGTYLIAYRMPAHIDRSKPEVFDGVIAAFGEYLKIKNVVVIEDPERGIIRTQDMMSPQSMANLAKDATADSFLLITVDRPVAAWLKVTVSAFDIAGTKLWEESASEGGGLTGKNAVEKTMAKLKPKLDHHVGQPGLPVKT